MLAVATALASPTDSFPSASSPSSASSSDDRLSVCFPRAHSPPTPPGYRAPADVAHPYARIIAKNNGTKRRKIWNHTLEKYIFSPEELSTMGAPRRRPIYIASLEAHVDQLHAQLFGLGLWPVDIQTLEVFKGLSNTTAKSMVSGLQHDVSFTRLKLLELERSTAKLQNATLPGSDAAHVL